MAEEFTGYTVITIPGGDTTVESKLRFVESDWIICVDGVTKTAIEYNRKTGETRPYSYNKALRIMFG